MKVILLKDVPKLGRKYEIKNVADGYAANMLLPRGLAMIATADAIRKIETEKTALDVEKKVQGELLAKALESLKGAHITISGKANDKGHLFAGVTKEMIAEEIRKTSRLNIDPESILLDKPIKETGEHTVVISGENKKIQFKVTIEGK